MVAGPALRRMVEGDYQYLTAVLNIESVPVLDDAEPGFGSSLTRLKFESRANGVVGEHLYGLERVVIEVLADQRKLLKDVVGHRDDLTSDRVGVEDVQQFALARPDQFGRRRHLQQFYRCRHHWKRILASISPTTTEHPHIAPHIRIIPRLSV